MAQNYSTFKTYVTTYLWRQNDTDLSNNLDVLIQQANDELDHMTSDWQRRQRTVVISPETQDFNLTTEVPDLRSIMSLTSNAPDSYFQSKAKTFSQTTLSDIYRLRAQNPGGPLLPFYATDRDNGTRYLRLVGPSLSASDPGDLTLVYRIAIPDYAADDASWMEDEYLNLYLYTILKHVAMFLREDERVVTYAGLQKEAFVTADADDKHSLQFGGSPLQMRPHHYAP